MIQRKDGKFSLPSLKRHTGELCAVICATKSFWKANSRTELYQAHQ